MYNDLVSELIDAVSDKMVEAYNLDQLVDIISYTAASFVVNYKLLLDKIMPLRGMTAPELPRYVPQPRRESGPKKLYLKLAAHQRNDVLSILSETPGRIPVVLVEIGEDGSRKAVQAPGEYWVDEGYDFGALANLIGADSIVLK